MMFEFFSYARVEVACIDVNETSCQTKGAGIPASSDLSSAQLEAKCVAKVCSSVREAFEAFATR